MARKLDIEDELQELPDFSDDDDADEVEEIPEIPAPPKKQATRKKASPKAAAVKEFDIRAAHQAWKEKYGIEDEYSW
jgi:hypothetical protein